MAIQQWFSYFPQNNLGNWTVPVIGKIYKVHLWESSFDGEKTVLVDEEVKLTCSGSPKNKIFDIGPFQYCRINKIRLGFFDSRFQLEIDEQPVEDYQKEFFKKYDTWKTDEDYVVLDKSTFNLWLNGVETETDRQFIDKGTLTTFNSNSKSFQIEAKGNPRVGLNNVLSIDDVIIPLYVLPEEV